MPRHTPIAVSDRYPPRTPRRFAKRDWVFILCDHAYLPRGTLAQGIISSINAGHHATKGPIYIVRYIGRDGRMESGLFGEAELRPAAELLPRAANIEAEPR